MKLFTNLDNIRLDNIYHEKTDDPAIYSLTYSTDIFELSNIPICFTYQGNETLETIANIEHLILDCFAKYSDTTPFYEVVKFFVSLTNLKPGDQYCLVFDRIKVSSGFCFIEFTFFKRSPSNTSM